MREYELSVIYDLALAENNGPEAGVERVTRAVEGAGGTVKEVDHWGRRRMAYPINKQIDGDYIISRIEIDAANVSAIEASLRIDESVYRSMVVRADELYEITPMQERRPYGGGRPDAPRPEGAETPTAEASAAPAADAEAPAAADAPAEAAETAPEAPPEPAPENEPVAEAPAEAGPAAEAPAEPAAEAEPETATEAEEPAAADGTPAAAEEPEDEKTES